MLPQLHFEQRTHAVPTLWPKLSAAQKQLPQPRCRNCNTSAHNKQRVHTAPEQTPQVNRNEENVRKTMLTTHNVTAKRLHLRKMQAMPLAGMLRQN
jgi:hypothetical protein